MFPSGLVFGVLQVGFAKVQKSIAVCKNVYLLLCNKSGTHWSEGIDEHTILEASAAVNDIWLLHEDVTSLDNLGAIANKEFEDTALNISDLAVRMAMSLALRTLLELNLDHHHIVIVAHNLAINFAWIWSALPLEVCIIDEIATGSGDVASINNLTISSLGNGAVRCCGKGAVGAARSGASSTFRLVTTTAGETSSQDGNGHQHQFVALHNCFCFV